jgi:hypothetical protein
MIFIDGSDAVKVRTRIRVSDSAHLIPCGGRTLVAMYAQLQE